MRSIAISVGLGMLLAGCAQVEGLFDRGPAAEPPAEAAPAPASAPPVARPADTVPMSGARTADTLDTSSAAERAEAAAPAPQGGGRVDLGRTIASLGAPTETGFWLKTPLTDRPGKGRVDYPDKGTSVVVDLIPLDAAPGSGSRMSLAAMRLIEADLTGLPEVRVFRLTD